MSYRDRPDAYDMRRWSQRTAKQRERRPGTRWLLAFGLVLVIGWPIVMIGFAGPSDRVFPSIGLLMPLIVGGTTSPFARESWLTAAGRADYDEFERAGFARATTWAYVLFLALMIAVFAYLWAAHRFALPLPRDATEWGAIATTVLLVGAGLPLTMAEFLVPLPPAGEEFE